MIGLSLDARSTRGSPDTVRGRSRLPVPHAIRKERDVGDDSARRRSTASAGAAHDVQGDSRLRPWPRARCGSARAVQRSARSGRRRCRLVAVPFKEDYRITRARSHDPSVRSACLRQVAQHRFDSARRRPSGHRAAPLRFALGQEGRRSALLEDVDRHCAEGLCSWVRSSALCNSCPTRRSRRGGMGCMLAWLKPVAPPGAADSIYPARPQPRIAGCPCAPAHMWRLSAASRARLDALASTVV